MQDSASGALLYKNTLSYDADREFINKQVEYVNGNEYTTTYAYDWDNRPTEVKFGSDTRKVRYSYDSQGRMTQRRVLNGSADQTTTYGYLASEQEIPNLNTESSTNLICRMTQPCISYVYGYAGNTDNLTSEKREGGSYAGTVTYEYDNLGQLTRVNDPKDTRGGSTGTTWVYTYDRGGNILSKKRYAYTTGALGTPQLTIPYAYGDTNWKDKLTALNGAAFEYDAIGNLTNDGAQAYEWTDGRKLAHTNNEATGMDVTYEYDHNGMRIRKSAGQHITNYTLRGDKIAYLTWGIYPNDKMRFEYDGQGRPAIVNFNGADYHYLYNLQGDVIGLIDSTGTLVVEYNYDAWGRIIGRTGSLVGTLGWLNPFRYRGYVYDEETGMYYLKSRYYNPEWGRFINADVVLGKQGALLSHNLFAYCLNNPVLLFDPSGRDPSAMLLVKQHGMTVAQLDGFLPFLDGAVVVWAASAWLSDAIGFTKWFVSVWPRSSGIVIDPEIDYEDNNYIEMPDTDVEFDDGIAYGKGHQGNMRDSGLRDVSDEELEERLKKPNISSEQKKRYQREQKARGLRDRQKREGYHHFTTNAYK